MKKLKPIISLLLAIIIILSMFSVLHLTVYAQSEMTAKLDISNWTHIENSYWIAWTWSEGTDGHWVYETDGEFRNLEENVLFANLYGDPENPSWDKSMYQTRDLKTVDGGTYYIEGSYEDTTFYVDGYWGESEMFIDPTTESTEYISEPIIDNNPSFIVDNVNTEPGAKNIAVNVAIKNNPGIASVLLDIDYDKSALSLKNFTYNSEVLAGTMTVPFNANAKQHSLSMVSGTSNVERDFVFATLYFDVADSACGRYNIILSYDENNVYNISEDNVDFDIVNGSINAGGEEPTLEVTEPTKPDFGDSPRFVVSKVNTDAGEKNVAVTVSIENNPGIASILLDIGYDKSALTLTGFAYNSTTLAGTMTVPFNANATQYSLSMVSGTSNVSGDFVFATLYFDIADNANGSYDITLSYDENNVYDIDEDNVTFDVINGAINVGGVVSPTEPTEATVPTEQDPSDSPAFVVSKVDAEASEKNVAVTVSIENNPGIASVLLDIGYDKSTLTLTGFTYNTNALAGTMTVPFNANAKQHSLSMVSGTSNINGDFVFATLYFDVADNANGHYDISLSYDDNNVYDINEENIEFEVVNGSINVDGAIIPTEPDTDTTTESVVVPTAIKLDILPSKVFEKTFDESWYVEEDGYKYLNPENKGVRYTDFCAEYMINKNMAGAVFTVSFSDGSEKRYEIGDNCGLQGSADEGWYPLETDLWIIVKDLTNYKASATIVNTEISTEFIVNHKNQSDNSDGLTVNIKANAFFPTVTKTYNPITDTITVAYYADIRELKLQAIQCNIYYDKSVLTVNKEKNGLNDDSTISIFPISRGNGDVNKVSEGRLFFTFSKWNGVSSYINGEIVPLFQIVFDVVDDAIGSTDINLEFEVLSFTDKKADNDYILYNVNGLNQDGLAVYENNGGIFYSTIDGTIPEQYIIGDANGDKTVDILDAAMIQKYTVDKVKFNDKQMYVADVNNDGTVDVLDAAMIQKYTVDKIDHFTKN